MRTKPGESINPSDNEARVGIAMGTHCKLTIKVWSEVFHVDKLPDKIAFYEGLRDRNGGKYAEYYRDTVAALKKAEKALAERRAARAAK